MKKLIFFVVFVVLSLVSYQYLPKTQDFPSLPYIPKSVSKSYNTPMKVGNVELMVEVVDTMESRAQGLSGRKSLCKNCGMLFDFGVEDTIPGFWMKDMLIPIDIIWINNGKVIGIENNVQPEPGKSNNELANYSPPGVIDYVLEVNAGFSKKQTVEVGQSVVFP